MRPLNSFFLSISGVHRLATGIVIALAFMPINTRAASKFDFIGGFFMLSATNSRGSSSISNLGSYQISYRMPIRLQMEFQLGYSLMASKTIGGDLGYGPDLGLLYFPMTLASAAVGRGENIEIESSEFFRPYIAGAFHQRQYQSTQSSYAGFSFTGGSEYLLRPGFSLRGELRYLRLIGPSNSTANQIDFLAGFSVRFGR